MMVICFVKDQCACAPGYQIAILCRQSRVFARPKWCYSRHTAHVDIPRYEFASVPLNSNESPAVVTLYVASLK